MHFHHHEFSRSVDPPLSVLSNPQKVSAVLPVRSFPPGPHQQRASLRFDSFFSECSPAPLEFVVGDRRRSSQDHGGQNYLPDASLTRLFTLLLFALILLLAQQFVERRRHTPRREGQKKSFCVFTSHPVSEEAEEEEEEEGNEPPECLTSEPGGHAHKSPMKGTTEGR